MKYIYSNAGVQFRYSLALFLHRKSQQDMYTTNELLILCTISIQSVAYDSPALAVIYDLGMSNDMPI